MRAIVANRIIPLLVDAAERLCLIKSDHEDADYWPDFVRWLGAMRAQGTVFRDSPSIRTHWLRVREQQCLQQMCRQNKCQLYYPDGALALDITCANISTFHPDGPADILGPRIYSIHNDVDRPQRSLRVPVEWFCAPVFIKAYPVENILCVPAGMPKDDVMRISKKFSVYWIVHLEDVVNLVDDNFQATGIKNVFYNADADLLSNLAKRAKIA